MPQEHDLIMMCHIIIGYRDRGGPHDCINQAVSTVGQGAMINPHVASPKEGHSITVRYSPPPVVPWGASHHSIPPWLTIVDADPVDYNVGHVLYGDAGSTGYVDVSSPAVDCFE